MLIRQKDDSRIKPSEVTPKQAYLNRRQILQQLGGLTIGAGLGLLNPVNPAFSSQRLAFQKNSRFSLPDITAMKYVTRHNNYYEFGTGKKDPARFAKHMEISPWTIEVEGLASQTGTFDLWKLIPKADLEERVYRFRCVERWAMVVPWVGIPLAAVIRKLEPLGSAKFVTFTTITDEKTMPGLDRDILPWPYVEGLRIDEAMHPLSFLAVGMYGNELPHQNGAPVRLVVPWKYGYKSIKAIVKIGFQDDMPLTSWHQQSPKEYGFYSNVNPNVNHPRWNQKKERLIGGGLFSSMRKTQMFNGYEEEVADLYKGMDLTRFR